MRQLASPVMRTFGADVLPTACRMLRGLLIGTFAAMRLHNMPVLRMTAMIHAGFLPGFFSRPGAVFFAPPASGAVPHAHQTSAARGKKKKPDTLAGVSGKSGGEESGRRKIQKLSVGAVAIDTGQR